MNYGFSSQEPTNETQEAGKDKTTADPAMGETTENVTTKVVKEINKYTSYYNYNLLNQHGYGPYLYGTCNYAT